MSARRIKTVIGHTRAVSSWRYLLPVWCAIGVALMGSALFASPLWSQATRTWTGGGANNNWTTAGNWGGIAPVAGDNLVFDAAGVAVRNAPANNFANGTIFGTITVSAAGYTFTGSSVSTTGVTVSTYASGTSTISFIIGGAGGVTMDAAGTLALSVANTFTGGLRINAGTVSGSNAASFGASASVITLGASSGADNATLNGALAGTFANPITVASGSSGTLSITNSAASQFSGAMTLQRDVVLAPTLTNLLTVRGGITGTGNVIVSGTGTTAAVTMSTVAINFSGTLTNQGTNTGTTTVSGGVGTNVTSITQSSTTSAMTISTTALTVNGSGTTLTNTAGTRLLTLSGGVSGTGSLILNNNSATAAAITVSTTSVNHTGTVTSSGTGSGTVVISAALGANVTGVTQNSATSALTLSGTNSPYAGTTSLSAGTLRLGSATALGGNGAANGTGGSLAIAGGTTLDATANTTLTTTNAKTINGDFTLGGSFTLNLGPGAMTITPPTLTITKGGTALATLPGAVSSTTDLTLNITNSSGITFSGAVNVDGTITNTGAGAGTTTFTGGVGSNVTAITESSLTTALTISTTALTVNSGGTTLTNALGTKLLTVSGGVAGTGALIVANNSATAAAITVSTTSVNHTGTVTNSGTGSGTVVISAALGANLTGVTQNSATSALTLSGTNSPYGGTTSLSAGTLFLGSATSLGGNGASNGTGGALVIAAGTTLDATATQTLTTTNAKTINGDFTLGGSAILNLGPGAVTLTPPAVTVTKNGTTLTTIPAAVDGTTDLTIDINGTSGVTVSGQVNVDGSLTNSGTGTGTLTLSGGVGSNVTQITESSTTSALTISSTALTVNAGGTTLTNALGTKLLTVSGGVAGTGALILHNNSTLTSGITLSTTSVNHTGSITNSGTGTGNALISAVIGVNVTGVTQNSATSMLTLSGTNTYAAPTTISAGVLAASATAALGDGSASNPLVFAGGTLRATSTITSPATRDVTLSADAIVDANGQTTTFSGIVSGAAGLTLPTAGTLRLNGAATIGGDVTILAGTLRGSSTAGLRIRGDFINDASYLHNSGTVFFDGAGTQTIGGSSATTFYTVEVDGAGLSIATTPTIADTLLLTDGTVTTGANRVIMASTGTITGASTSSYVIGTIEHNIPNAAAPTAHFPVGDATHFAPVSLTFAGTTSGSGSLTVTTTAGDHPNIATSHGDPTRSVNRYWTIDNTTVAGFTSYDATFSFPAGELDGGVTTSALAVRRYTSGAWTVPLSTNQLPTSTTGTGMTGFSDFAIAEGIPDAAETSLTPTTASITADGVSTQVLTVTARDAGGNPLSAGGATVIITRQSGSGIIGPVTDVGDGTYTATVTAPTAVGSGVFVATFAGNPVQGGTGSQTQATVSYTVGAASADASTLTPTTASITADGTSTQLLTVTALDAYDNPLTTGGATVTITQQSGTGTISAVTDVGDGTYTATVTSPTAVGSGVFVASLGGAPVKSGNVGQTTAAVDYTAGAADAALSTLTPVSASIIADGTSTQVLTVTAVDANGNPLTIGGATVTITQQSGTGSIGAVTDVGDGTYTATVTSPTAVGSGVFVATLGGNPVEDGTASQTQATITYTVGAAAAARSTLTPASASITADGASTQLLTVTALDANGNDIATGGATVTITRQSGTGSISAVTDVGDGSYTAIVTSPTAAGSGVFVATLDGNPVQDGTASQTQATVTYTAGAADAARSTLTPTSASITADGASTRLLTVTALDANGNALPNGGATVTITRQSGTGTISAVTDVGDGTYTAIVTSPTAVGSGVFIATLGGNPVQDGTASQTQATVTYAVGAADAAHSTLTPTSASITADGASTQVLTVTAHDANGNALGIGGAIVTIIRQSGTGTIGAVTDVGNGTYTATATSPTAVGSGVFVATLGGDPVQDGTASQTQATLTYAVGAVNAARSTLTPASASITADGASTQVLTVTALDANGNALSTGGATVTITRQSGSGSISAVTDVGDGTYTATVTSPTAVGSGIFVATLGGSSVQDGTASQTQSTVTYTVGAADAARSTLTPTSTSITADGTSTQVLTVTALDAHGNALSTGGATVTITRQSGTGSIGAVTDVGNGTYTATVTSPTAVGSGVFVATLSGTSVQDGTASQTQATVTYTVGAADAARSTLTPTSASITANGTSTQVLTVTALDANGNALPTGGATVTITRQSGTGSISAVTDVGNGTYTATVTSPTAVGSGVFVATLGGNPVQDGTASQTQATVTYTVGAADAARSTLTPPSASIIANGTSTQVLTVTALDANGNALATGGATVTITRQSGTGSISAITDVGNGTYTATVTSPTAVGSGIFVATLGGISVQDGTASQTQTTVTYTVGAANAARSTLIPTSASITANGTSTQVLTVTALDANDNALPTGGATVTITRQSGTGAISGVTDVGNGTYTATVTSPTAVGSGVFVATLGGAPVQDGTASQTQATVTYTVGAADAARSTLTPTSTSITASGTSTQVLTVTALDANGNALATGGATVTITRQSGTGTISAVTDVGNGAYTATVTSPTAVGNGVFVATLGGNPIQDGTASQTQATVTYTVGAADAARSTLTPTSASITANGTSTQLLTVTAYDANGNALASGGATVTISRQSGTGSISAVTDVGNGTYTATVTSPTAVGSGIFVATLGGTPVQDGTASQTQATVTYTVGAADAARSTLTPTSASITANGTSTEVLTVTALDANGNALSTGGATVTITRQSGTGTISAVTDVGNGTFTATVTSPTTVGSGIFVATLGGNPVQDGTASQTQATVTYSVGAADAARSTLTPASASITADGTSTQVLTVTALDANGNPLPTGGATVTITRQSGTGTISAVTDVGNGTYTATVTSPTAVGSGIFVATLGGTSVQDGTASQTQATVTYTVGAADAARSTLAPTSASITANGTSTRVLTVTALDANGNALATGGAAITITRQSGTGTVSGVTDIGNGTYTATVTSPTAVGSGVFVATLGGTPVQDGTASQTQATVTYTVGAADAARSTLTPASASITADGTSTQVLTVAALDANGNALTTGGATVTITRQSGTGSISAVTDVGNGTYTATVTSPTAVGSGIFVASLGGSSVQDGTASQTQATVTYAAGAADAARSTLTPASASITANGTSTQVLTVTALDANGNPLPAGGATVTITRQSGTGTISAVTDVGNGTYTATVTSPTAAGSGAFVATLGGAPVQDGTASQTQATVTYTVGAVDAARSILTPTSASITANGSSTQVLTVTALDANGNALSTGGATITITRQSGTGTISGVTDVGNGTYTATVTSPTAVGSGVFVATLGGNPVQDGTASQTQATVTYTVGAADAAHSTLTPTSASITADGISTQVLTVTALDANGNALTTGGATVTVTRQSGTGGISAVTDVGNGTYTATVTSPTAVGSGVFVATLGGNPVQDGTASQTQATVSHTVGAADAARSTLTPASASITANGTSTQLLTVTALDANGNALTTGGATVTITRQSGTGSIGAVTDVGNGTYTATVTSPTAVGSGVFVATLGGSSVQDGTASQTQATVTFAVGAADAARSTLTPISTSITADGTSTQVLTVTALDANGNALATGGATVTISSQSGTGSISAVTDVGNGSYTATVTSPAAVGSGVFVATLGGNPVQDGTASQTQATVTYTVGAADAARSTLTPTSASITADGTSTQLLTVTAYDANGNALASGGASVTITRQSGTGTISAVTDVGNGTYTATVTSPTAVGSGVFVATLGGNPVQDGTASQTQATVTYAVGAADAARSTLTPANASITADGTSTQLLTVTAYDANGNALPAGGATVTITRQSGTGTIGAVTDVGNGTYTATVTSPTAVGSGVFVATLGGNPVQDGTASQTQATVTYAVGAANAARSTLAPTSASITANGSSTQLLTVTAYDANGNPISGGGATVTITRQSGTGTIGAVTDVGNGTYTSTVTSPTAVGSGVFVATLGGNPVQDGTATQTQATVTYTVGAADAARSTLTPTSAGLTADGVSTQLLTVTAYDATGNPLPAGGATVTITRQSGTGSIGAVTDVGDGTYTATVTAPAAVGSGVFVATFGGNPVLGGTASQVQATVTYSVGAANAAASTLTPAAASITANGTSTQVLTVSARDASGNALSTGGATVSITRLSGTGTIGSVTDVGNGTYTATVTAPAAVGTGTFVATLGGAPVQDGAGTQTQAVVTYVVGAASAARSTLTPQNSGITADGTSTQLLTVTALDATGNPLTTGGSTITITRLSGSGTIGPVADVGNGTYTAVVTSPTVAGSGIFVATLGGAPVQGGTASQVQARVGYGAGPAVASNSLLTPPTASLQANPVRTQRLIVTARDAGGNHLSTGGAVVTITRLSGIGTIGPVTDIGNGTYAAVVTAPSTVGSGVFVATLGGAAVQGGMSGQVQVTITFTAGPLSAATTMLTPTSASVTADGVSTQTLTVTTSDEYGNPITTGGAEVTITRLSGNGTIGAVTDAGGGRYTAQVTSPTAIGTGVFVATVGGLPVRNGTNEQARATISYGAGAAGRYVVSVSKLDPVVRTPITVSAQLLSTSNHPVTGTARWVTWTKSLLDGKLSTSMTRTNAEGIATVTFTPDSIAGVEYVITASDETGPTGTSATIVTVADAPSPVRSTAVVPLDGSAESPVAITVRLTDRYGNVLGAQAAAIGLRVRGANAGTTGAPASSDPGGSYTTAYTPMRPGVDTVTVLVNGVAMETGTVVRRVSALLSDLSVNFTTDMVEPVVGDTVTIVMTVTNAGPGAAAQTQIDTDLPLDRFETLSIVVSQGSFDAAAQRWTIGTVAPRASVTLTYRGVVKLPPSS
ncbi:MAG: hypothetical protein IPF98_21920 [Gemmatimonadetes bacterium]|nr:hypothetical protein [Gemmatimonadota bacterium]